MNNFALAPAAAHCTDGIGMEIKRDRKNRSLSINQTQAIITLLEKHDMRHTKSVTSPMDSSWTYGSEAPETNPERITKYRSQVASILFFSNCTRPDLAYSVSMLSRHLHNPNENCFKALTHVMRWLATTPTLGIHYTAPPPDKIQLEAYADASWGNDDEHAAKSPQGHLVYFAGGLIDWSASLQPIVALSTAEAEHISAFHCARSIVYYRELLEEFGHPPNGPTLLWEDNQACIAQSKNPVNHKRNKHMLIRYHYLRDLTEMNLVQLNYIGTLEDLNRLQIS
jgi:hypothetical protein